MEITPVFTTTTRSDSQGNWKVRVDALDPGYHQIVVTEENGGQDTAPLFIEQGKGERILVVQDRPTWQLRVEQYIPPYLAYALLGLLVLFIFGTLLALLLSKYRKRFWALFLIAVILGLAALGAFYLNRLAGGKISFPIPPDSAPAYREPVDARGTVVVPFGKTPVAGLDLVFGDTAIRTSQGGQFAFQNTRRGDTIRLTHPLLHRAVDWRLAAASAPIEIPFDAGLYNAAVAMLDTEARGRREEIFQRLAKPFEGEVSRSDFLSSPTLYDGGNVSDQSLVVSGVRFEEYWKSSRSGAVWKGVAIIGLVNGVRHQEYAFVLVDGVWKPAY